MREGYVEIYNPRFIGEMKEQLGALLSIAKDYNNLDEAREYFVQQHVLREMIETNDELEGIDIKSIGSLARFAHRAWLFEYKGRGYVLLDNSNGHYNFCCSAEEFLHRLKLTEIAFDDNSEIIY